MLHRDLSLLGQPGQGFYHAGVCITGQEHFAGAAVVQRTADLLCTHDLVDAAQFRYHFGALRSPGKGRGRFIGRKGAKPLSPQFQIITDRQAPVKHKSTRIPQSFPPLPSGFRRKQETALLSPLSGLLFQSIAHSVRPAGAYFSPDMRGGDEHDRSRK